ncbi:MAG TPA: patatin-like phospholipase family protein [Solirubrobacteraceae bacterium]|nr:patatin-like phospholipase family protein [Solirubrobacteraceae bacterium]
MLGAGGVLGGAWLTGALHAIATETGWDPGSAQHVVGTSAGAMVGALLACGVPPWFMVAHSSGEQFLGRTDPRGQPASSANRSAGASFKLERGTPALGPGSWRLALSSLARPYRYSPAAVLSGWLPLGPISTEPLKDTVRRVCVGSWAPHPNYWAVAVDYQTGERVAFGSDGSPPAPLPDAVAASCAIPGFYRAVEIEGRRYVDGGLRSASNLDILAEEGLDLVIALNPMSSLHASSPRTLGERVAFSVRQNSGKRLGSEARRLRERGTEVLLIQPTVHDLDVMGTNLMSRGRRHDVIETAVETMSEHLHESALGERLAELPPGVPELVRRPKQRLRALPDFTELAAARWTQPAARAARAAPVISAP